MTNFCHKTTFLRTKLISQRNTSRIPVYGGRQTCTDYQYQIKYIFMISASSPNKIYFNDLFFRNWNPNLTAHLCKEHPKTWKSSQVCISLQEEGWQKSDKYILIDYSSYTWPKDQTNILNNSVIWRGGKLFEELKRRILFI